MLTTPDRSTKSKTKIFVFATKGHGTNEEKRILKLLENFELVNFEFDRSQKLKSFFKLMQQAIAERPNLIAMEGTGTAGGFACLLLRWFYGIPYVFSSGDAVAPFIGLKYPILVPIFRIYEQMLYAFCAGFIGWTPYLVGRALTFGAPKGMTAAGWSFVSLDEGQLQASRTKIRNLLGIPDEALVFGILGALVWNKRAGYCYGYELIQAFRRIERDDVCLLIVGDGDGLATLKELAGEDLNRRIFLPGNVPLAEVTDYMAAMDVGSLPQSVDLVGSFRYTTKISEYVSAKLPVVTSQIPMAYDLDEGWLWRLPGAKPWEEVYLDALANLMAKVTREEIREKRKAIPVEIDAFNVEDQTQKVKNFIDEIV
jgi:hypothetical protein